MCVCVCVWLCVHVCTSLCMRVYICVYVWVIGAAITASCLCSQQRLRRSISLRQHVPTSYSSSWQRKSGKVSTQKSLSWEQYTIIIWNLEIWWRPCTLTCDSDVPYFIAKKFELMPDWCANDRKLETCLALRLHKYDSLASASSLAGAYYVDDWRSACCRDICIATRQQSYVGQACRE